MTWQVGELEVECSPHIPATRLLHRCFVLAGVFLPILLRLPFLLVIGILTSIRLDSISGKVKCHGRIGSEGNEECREWDADASDVQNTLTTALTCSEAFYPIIVIYHWEHSSKSTKPFSAWFEPQQTPIFHSFSASNTLFVLATFSDTDFWVCPAHCLMLPCICLLMGLMISIPHFTILFT